jgi:molybdopterin-guanine dinucleotide biosynthesis protein A
VYLVNAASPSSLRIAGAVLAGGAASRMGGRPKGLLERAPGQPIILHLLRVLRQAQVQRAVVVTNDFAAYQPLGCETIADLRPGLGPLAGIETALAHFADQAEAVAFLPCDLPAITAREVSHLLRAFTEAPSTVSMAVAGHDRFYRHPCCCVVSCAALPAVRRSLDRDELKIGLLWRDLAMREVYFPDARPFHNINTPAEYQAWRAQQQLTLATAR